MESNVFETANAGFAQAMYEEFLRDPSAVGPEWRRLFESGVVGEKPNGADGAQRRAGTDFASRVAFEVGAVDPGRRAAAEPAPAGTTTAPEQATEPAPGRQPARLPASASQIKGPAARLVANMTESLSVPTATTLRTIAVANLEARRKELNSRLQTAGRKEKLSFTHLIAFALVQAAKRHPVMGHTLLIQDGVPYRVQPEGIGLGLAVDVQRKDGSRGLVVPVIKRADTMDFGAFHAAYEALVEKARANQLMPDDFIGSTIQLTNPGGLGTVASVPRLMAGQGSIIAVGAIGYPVEFSSAPEEKLRELGVSKVMTATSTYDHRVIQGAESGAFLATLDHLLQGEEHFYETVAESLQLAAVSYQLAPAATQLPKTPDIVAPEMLYHVAAGMALVKAFRTHGHLAAHTDPLGNEPLGDPALDLAPLGLNQEIMAAIPSRVLRVYVPGRTLAESYPYLQQTYCGTMAYQVEHISSHQERVWLREKIESGAFRTPLSPDEKKRLLGRLTKVEALERFLHKAYLGHKRFSIEGVDLLVPMLDLTLELAASTGAREVVIGMAHRGRLNVLAHIIGRPYETIFAEFEGGRFVEGNRLTPEGGTGDVKYHHGAEGAFPLRNGKSIAVTLSPNPSHLEFVSPVVDGRARATQTLRKGRSAHHDPTIALPVLIHGDAAFAAQGVVAETLNLSALPGYGVGGTLHIITNNQIGFTTDTQDARSTRYASDLAKGFDAPIIHVNSDDAEACLAAIRLAMAYREKFRRDVLIDLVGYRRHGHNEGDEPTYTQPVMYERIKQLPPVRTRYAEQLAAEGVVSADEANQQAEGAYQRLVDAQQRFKASLGKGSIPEPPKPTGPGHEVATAVAPETLTALNEQLLTWPPNFAVNPKLKKQLERRRSAVGPEGGIEWAHAEALALASLVVEGVPVRLTGQDTERGTFSQRHLVLHDIKTGQRYAPIQRLPGALAPLELHNSPLSELASLGFEYGYSAEAAEALVLWEAQFGDFINGGQVIVDQFLSAGLSKWGLTTRLTLLLPHGYEGQGPEHSSARLERFLQLCAEGNIRVANPTTPAQYFHLLRRQARRSRQRPLIVMTPKSLLRHPQATSRLEDLAEGTWRPVFDDPWASDGNAAAVTRLVLCSGKLYYELLAEAEKMTAERPALIRLEQLYSFPWQECRQVLARYPKAQQLIWAQEEPRNMGAWTYLEPKLRELLPAGAELRYVGRPERASPAEGYPAAHVAEQSRIVGDALGVKQPRLSRETVVTGGEGQG
ncbi:MAG TPA: multifunctional oxoglutarate decarboxylase/oxoglutarate dehydrogenase thiamine pyrophosphate-binding subunit/dihydrolipoyllysine-residue succinyltransferase subunit [Gemmatimonadales bacterium]|nr:multifunctional oxoglutarate decarboxylase/oxoglutarate dehydrogenase thiamine pyrophosphate-binding subunit/dihydrolipoyllysine-residue succinyltransferase subunit [Gemmatimonadales bacterium]